MNEQQNPESVLLKSKICYNKGRDLSDLPIIITLINSPITSQAKASVPLINWVISLIGYLLIRMIIRLFGIG